MCRCQQCFVRYMYISPFLYPEAMYSSCTVVRRRRKESDGDKGERKQHACIAMHFEL